MRKTDFAAHIEVIRYRYARNPRSGKTSTYTEYRFYIDYVLECKAIRGQITRGQPLFMSLSKFKMHCLVKFKQPGIDVLKPEYRYISEPEQLQ